MLSDLRGKIEGINRQILSLLTERQEAIDAIQTQKSICWDPEREKEIFAQYIAENPNKSLSEDFIFSYIMQTQSKAYGYPQFSEGVHLTETSGLLQEKINPILLMLRNEVLYKDLKISEEYKF